jgi:hypothetical protein
MSFDSESEQIREVYAYYGLAMYWAQCLEQSIFQHLLLFDHFPRAVAGYTTPENWAADFDRYEERELGQTMGKLIRRLQEVGRPTDGIEGSLAEVLKARNWLAHGYFADRALEFTTQNGRETMLEELQGAKDKFQRCATELDAVSLPAARARGFNDEMLAKVESEMVAAYASRTGVTRRCGG